MTNPSKDTPTKSDTPEREVQHLPISYMYEHMQLRHMEVVDYRDYQDLERSRNELMELCVEIRELIYGQRTITEEINRVVSNSNEICLFIPEKTCTKLCEATKGK